MKSNDKNFVKRLQKEKEDALEYIVNQYLPLVKGISFKILGPIQNEGLLEECINDIFLSIWNNAKKFKGDTSNFKYWVATIARFKAIDYYRRAIKNNEVEADFLEFQADFSVEEKIIQAENKEEILALINRTLDPVDQKIIVMRYFLDMGSEEISEKLNLTKSAVDSRIFRGRKKLNKQAKNYYLGGSLGERYL
ncbi:RNA polymerase sigma-70 factor, ECF subfamily [Oceanobacillus limi]|uniref:RNA polymerase sigma-70 factor, ECF subfamily n=1 Tax=Oceanobacillus limi TaxID=930131 RepID=A0A1I0CR63_9BACI|nr:sigma-70 family RNA polymerase sigma factor [Oceanobacillus limi]SET22255.1 RNA polymerase sigma-70 factor, ECF subfamily [Oceanobacillus limi]